MAKFKRFDSQNKKVNREKKLRYDRDIIQATPSKQQQSFKQSIYDYINDDDDGEANFYSRKNGVRL